MKANILPPLAQFNFTTRKGEYGNRLTPSPIIGPNSFNFTTRKGEYGNTPDAWVKIAAMAVQLHDSKGRVLKQVLR